MDKVSWPDYFMTIASVACIRSPDDSTKHGAVIVDEKHRILGLGYNGTPRGRGNTVERDPVYPKTRPEKYKYIAHAELNAILNCSVRPDGATVYVTGRPCSGCMVAMIQSGIRVVIFGGIGSACVDQTDWEATCLLAKNHGVSLLEYRQGRDSSDPRSILQKVAEYLNNKGWYDGEKGNQSSD